MDIKRSTTSTGDGPPPGLQVVGLDRQCYFTLHTPRKITIVRTCESKGCALFVGKKMITTKIVCPKVK